MKIHPTILFFCLTLFLNFNITNLTAQDDPVVQRIIEIGKNDNRTMQHLDIICNRFGGRLVGSDAYENAANWVAHKFKSWGMDVIMDEAGSVPVGFNRGPWFGRMLSEDGMHLHFATPSYTSGTKGAQRGHVVMEPKNWGQFNKMKGRLNGAWVLITGKNKGWPIDYSQDANDQRTYIIEENKQIRIKNREIRKRNNTLQKGVKKEALIDQIDQPALFYQEMVDAGILGIIQSSPIPLRVLYDRKNIEEMTFETLPVIPDIKLNEHQYQLIKQKVIERRDFELEFDIRNHFKMGPVKFHNVIGVIPGSEFPDEYVILGGHLDAYDVATGGVDDGSGVTPSMEAARMIMAAGGKPKRTILVFAWAAEEFGLWGSKSWISRNKTKLPQISNMFNRDGGPTVPIGLSVSESMWDDLEKICAPINEIDPRFPFKLMKRTANKIPEKACCTDAGSFEVHGIPTMTFQTGDPLGFDFNYQEIWHTERDLYNKSIPVYQNHTSTVTALVVYGIANLDHLLSREGYFED